MTKIESGHWKLHFDYKYLGSQDMTVLMPNGDDLQARIVSLHKEIVEGESGKKDNCIIAELELLDGTKIKPMIVNKTNFKNAALMFKSEDVKDFIGKVVYIYVKHKVWNGKEYVSALRFRDSLQKIELRPIAENELEKAAKHYAKNGNLDAFRQKRLISQEVEQSIIELSKTLSND